MNKGLGKGGKGLGGTMTASKRHRRPLRDNIQGFSKPAIKRLAHRAGVLKIASQVYDEMRYLLQKDVNIIIKAAIEFMQFDKRKIIMQKDIKKAFEFCGVDLLVGVNENTHDINISKAKESVSKRKSKSKKGEKSHRFKSGTVVLRDIRYQQKHSDTLIIPKVIFKRIVQEEAQNFVDEFKISKVALKLFQIGIEHSFVSLLEMSYLCTIHRHSKTLMSRDIQLTRRILSTRNIMIVCGNIIFYR